MPRIELMDSLMLSLLRIAYLFPPTQDCMNLCTPWMQAVLVPTSTQPKNTIFLMTVMSVKLGDLSTHQKSLGRNQTHGIELL